MALLSAKGAVRPASTRRRASSLPATSTVNGLPFSASVTGGGAAVWLEVVGFGGALAGSRVHPATSNCPAQMAIATTYQYASDERRRGVSEAGRSGREMPIKEGSSLL